MVGLFQVIFQSVAGLWAADMVVPGQLVDSAIDFPYTENFIEQFAAVTIGLGLASAAALPSEVSEKVAPSAGFGIVKET